MNVWVFIIIFLVIIPLESSENFTEIILSTEQPSLKPIINFNDYLKNYDSNVRPKSESGKGPVKVQVDLFIRSISNVDEANMEYSVQLTLRESWIDPRLSYGNDHKNASKYLVLGQNQNIWRPDTFIYNEKQAHKHDIDQPNVLTRVYKDGRVLYSVRLTLTLSCPMNLQSYPLDVQHCNLKMASYAWTTDDIEYSWRDTTPIQKSDGLEKSLPQFTLSNISVGYCHSKTITGAYSCLEVTFELSREFGYYMVHLYLPGVLLVVVSWISFWLDPNAVPGRVTLGVTTLLTMATQASGVSARLPPVSYAKAIDVWIGLCTSYLFGALIEFAFVTFLYNKQLDEQFAFVTCAYNKPYDRHKSILHEFKTKQTNAVTKPWMIRRIMREIEKDAKIVDCFSRVLFPSTFVLCNIIYWIYYTRDWTQ